MPNKFNITFLIFFITYSNSFGQFNFDREDYYLPRGSKNHTFKNPPGTVFFKENLYIDSAPVDNLMYLEFLHSTKYFWDENVSQKIKELPKYGLNMTLMKQKFDGMNVNPNFIKAQNININLMVAGNHKSDDFVRHPSYSYYPIVNINREQAEMYCKWRTDVVNILMAYYSSDIKKRKKYSKILKYRLPTQTELNEALELFGHSKKRYKKNISIPFIMYRSSYKKKYKKAYFLKNNISEITSDSTLFGSNWKNSNDTNLPNDYSGFRCVCEVAKE